MTGLPDNAGRFAGATVTLTGASVFYGEVIGLSRVDMALSPGITGIVGPNGSGKSTMMRVLTGLMPPSEGAVNVFGGPPFSRPEIRRRIAIVPATECFFDALSGQRNLEVASLSHGLAPRAARERAQRGLDLVGLTADGHRRYGTWSRGMRQRLKLALVLAGEAELVLLDEPFLGVDPPSRRLLRTHILDMATAGRTVLVSSHVLHEIESLTDLVGVLAHGRLLGFGKIEQLLLDLRDRHPHRVHVACDRARDLAAALLPQEHIREVRVTGPETIEFVTERPEVAYRELAAVAVECGVLIRRLETLDNTLEAVFRHVTAAGAARL
jgi:ABC-2 type transport system ATP-binding protein